MSGYLAGLVARAAPLAADPAAPSVSPEAPATMRDADDPFEATVHDAPAWPATPRAPAAKSDDAPAPLESRAPAPGPPIEARVVDAAPAAIEPAARAEIDERDDTSEGPARSTSSDRVASIAQTLRPAADLETPPLQRSRASEDATAAPSPPPIDPLSIADRFMAHVVPPALLPPELRIETTREIVRAAAGSREPAPVHDDAVLQPQAAPEPADTAAEPRGLVIGTLRVNVVPPAPQPVAAPRPAARSPRVVVVTSGAAAPGVPSFSRFG